MNQLIKKNKQQKLDNVYPITFIDTVKDKTTGVSLNEILSSFNMYFLPFKGNKYLTRLQVPITMRRKGFWITYIDNNDFIITEYYGISDIGDDPWQLDYNWRDGTNFLTGDISISTDGYWVINNIVTEHKAQGKEGITPLLRTKPENKLEVSYNQGVKWEIISDYIAAWFRWEDNKIQISRDNQTWEDLSGKFLDNFSVKGYADAPTSLPSSADLGTIYLVGPTEGRYTLYIYMSSGWKASGEFAGLPVGVTQELGNSTTEVPSVALVTKEFNKIQDSVKILTEEEYNAIPNKDNGVFYFIYEEE